MSATLRNERCRALRYGLPPKNRGARFASAVLIAGVSGVPSAALRGKPLPQQLLGRFALGGVVEITAAPAARRPFPPDHAAQAARPVPGLDESFIEPPLFFMPGRGRRLILVVVPRRRAGALLAAPANLSE